MAKRKLTVVRSDVSKAGDLLSIEFSRPITYLEWKGIEAHIKQVIAR